MPVPVRGAKQRALLALQAQIGQLRRTLGTAAVITAEAGQAIDLGPEDVDVARFEHLAARGRRLAGRGNGARVNHAGRSARAAARGAAASPMQLFAHV